MWPPMRGPSLGREVHAFLPPASPVSTQQRGSTATDAQVSQLYTRLAPVQAAQAQAYVQAHTHAHAHVQAHWKSRPTAAAALEIQQAAQARAQLQAQTALAKAQRDHVIMQQVEQEQPHPPPSTAAPGGQQPSLRMLQALRVQAQREQQSAQAQLLPAQQDAAECAAVRPPSEEHAGLQAGERGPAHAAAAAATAAPQSTTQSDAAALQLFAMAGWQETDAGAQQALAEAIQPAEHACTALPAQAAIINAVPAPTSKPPPGGSKSQRSKVSTLTPPWQEFTHNDGRKYYYNSETQVTLTLPPAPTLTNPYPYPYPNQVAAAVRLTAATTKTP